MSQKVKVGRTTNQKNTAKLYKQKIKKKKYIYSEVENTRKKYVAKIGRKTAR